MYGSTFGEIFVGLIVLFLLFVVCDVLVGFHDNYFTWSVLDKCCNIEGSQSDIYNR